jgi:hypothetical protein
MKNITFTLQQLNEQGQFEVLETVVTQSKKQPTTMFMLFETLKKKGEVVKIEKWVEGSNGVELLKW